MPTQIKVASLIFDDLVYNVPSTVEEYNALDPKRVQAGGNPCVEDAVDNIMKHRVLGGFRSDFLDEVEKKFGIERLNNGTEKEPRWEPDAKFMNRVIALVAQQRGMDPTSDATRNALVSELRDLAQATLSKQVFTVAGAERTGGGQPVGKGDLKLATEAYDSGKIGRLAELLGKALNRTVDVSGDKDAQIKAVAVALRDKRRQDAEAKEAELKAALA